MSEHPEELVDAVREAQLNGFQDERRVTAWGQDLILATDDDSLKVWEAYGEGTEPERGFLTTFPLEDYDLEAVLDLIASEYAWR